MPIKTLNNQDGFALMASMLFLVALTIIGIAATNTTTIEIGIAGNDKFYKQNFYQAEGAAMEASQDDPEDDAVIVPGDGEALPLTVLGDTDVTALCSQAATGLGANTIYGVVDNGIPAGILGAGESLKASGTGAGGRAHFLDLYGQSTENNTSVGIIMGFTTRF